jgi:hypothetical protein
VKRRDFESHIKQIKVDFSGGQQEQQKAGQPNIAFSQNEETSANKR